MLTSSTATDSTPTIPQALRGLLQEALEARARFKGYVIELYDQGHSMYDIGESCGIDEDTVLLWRREENRVRPYYPEGSCRLDQHAAGGRRYFHAVAVAIEQLGAKPPFEGLDAPADRRLLGIQLRCCSAEAACLSNRKEETDIVPVAENIRHLGLASRSSIHCDNRYNKVVGPKFT